MNNDIHKKKSDVLASIMANPKLARTFKEAMAAPIGSTKRDQAKSILSIMRKVGGSTFDGQGGPFDPFAAVGSAFNTGAQNLASTSTPSTPNYSNLMIFPAAPAFKSSTSTQTSTPAMSGNMSIAPGGMSVAPKTQTQSPSLFDDIWNTVKGVGNYAVHNLINIPSGVGIEPLSQYNDLKKAVTPAAPVQIPYAPPKAPEIGALHQAKNFVEDNAWKVPAAILGSVAGLGDIAMSGIQYGLQNAYQGATDIWNFAVDPEQRIPKVAQPGYTSWGNTQGMNNLAEMVGPGTPSTVTPPAKTTPTDTTKGPVQGPTTGTTGTAPAVTVGTVVTNPQDVQDLKSLQDFLVKNNFMTADQANSEVNTYGTSTAAAVKAAQAAQAAATGTSGTSGTTGSTSTGDQNLAATNIAKILGVSYDTSLNNLSALDIAKAIPVVEGYVNGTSTVAVTNNNPGNLKYAGQAGATQDSNGFAVFQTPQDGAKALLADITAKMNSGKYATLNDLMSVYSPNSDNPGYTGPSSIDSAMAADVKAGGSGSAFALNTANKMYGGGLEQYITNLDTKLQNQFNLPALETQLSQLKDAGTNLVPTLQTYMAGRDTYLKSINDMIDKTKDGLANLDAGDPTVMNAYNRQLTYLYDLKGKQESRYQNFLNSAISDYNADLSKVTNAYTTAKNAYTTAMTSQGTMAQNDYNNLVTTLTNAHSELENAPTKAANLAILQQQAGISNLNTINNGINSGITTNPKYWTDVTNYSNQITNGGTGTDKDAINFTNIPANGLIGLYTQNVVAGGDEMAMTESIRRGLKATLDSNPGNPAIVNKVKKLVTDLAADPRGASFAAALSNTVNPAVSSELSSYITSHIADVKSALSDLVKGGSGFLWTGLGARKAGIKDQTGWMASHSNLDKDFLTNLYNLVNANVQPGTTYEKNPQALVDQLFPSGKTPAEQAALLAAGMSVI